MGWQDDSPALSQSDLSDRWSFVAHLAAAYACSRLTVKAFRHAWSYERCMPRVILLTLAPSVCNAGLKLLVRAVSAYSRVWHFAHLDTTVDLLRNLRLLL